MSKNNRRLLLSLAHPDDEAFGFGGTIARYHDEGVAVHLICATDGDVGTIDDEFMENFSTIAERRLYELQCAAEVLGLTLHTFGYRDSGMQGTPDNDHPDSLAQADVDEVAERVTEVIRQTRPHIVATFDPFGGYGHPDHIAIHKATIQAFHAAGDADQYPHQLKNGLTSYQPQKLYYRTFDRSRIRWMIRLAPLLGIDPTRMGRNHDMNYKEMVQNEWPTHTRLRIDDYIEIAQKAWKCHASQQMSSTGFGIINRLFRRRSRHDTYMRVHPPVNGRVRERDLFESVTI